MVGQIEEVKDSEKNDQFDENLKNWENKEQVMIAGRSSNPYLAFQNKLNAKAGGQELLPTSPDPDGPEALATSNPFLEQAQEEKKDKKKKDKKDKNNKKDRKARTGSAVDAKNHAGEE